MWGRKKHANRKDNAKAAKGRKDVKEKLRF